MDEHRNEPEAPSRAQVSYLIFTLLAIVLFGACGAVAWMVIELLLDNTATESIAIMAGLGAVAGGLAGVLFAVGVLYISVTEAQGEVKPPTP